MNTVLRVVSGILHALLALTTAIDALWFGGQARLNALWEVRFYGEVSLGTTILLLAAALAMVLAAVQASCGIAFVFDRRGSALGIALLSMLYLLFAPAPLSALMALTLVVAGHRMVLAWRPPTPTP